MHRLICFYLIGQLLVACGGTTTSDTTGEQPTDSIPIVTTIDSMPITLPPASGMPTIEIGICRS